jgi:ubiquinone/menaquinone biosynthesis C-methylase UbiE
MDLQLELLKKERSIYEPAVLYPQQRKDPKELLEILASPEIKNGELKLFEGYFECTGTGKKFPVTDRVVNFIETPEENKNMHWEKLNKQFLNYHKSLSPYTLLNSTPLLNYISARSKIGFMKNITALDVGGGTGHTLCSFFRYPETIHYILMDPNLRLLHDQFIRIYPRLGEIKMAHLLGFAESLPVKSESMDVVLSISSIDHFADFRKFISEAFRVLKIGGKLLISSHLDLHAGEITKNPANLVSYLEKAARFFYYRKYKVKGDDHTYHFNDTLEIENELKKNKFEITANETFLRYFYMVAEKNM